MQGTCNRPDLTIFLEYLSALRPAGYRDTLRHCYTRLKQQFPRKSRQATTYTAQDFMALSYWDQFQPLLLLMSDDDEWAWHEFAHRLRRDDVPFHTEQFSGPSFHRFPMYVIRLSVLADWYVLIRRQRHNDNWVWSDLAQHLLETIVAIGGEKAIQELQRLQKTDAFPDARWLSHAILRIEDRLLSEESVPWESGAVLDFINKERLGVILNERDLFEWVCQAIEELQEGLEQCGEGVAGFWKGNIPHHEAWCQNVLWPLLRLTLQRSDITVAEGEEKSIGPNRCDFWVEYPRSGAVIIPCRSRTKSSPQRLWTRGACSSSGDAAVGKIPPSDRLSAWDLYCPLVSRQPTVSRTCPLGKSGCSCSNTAQNV